MKTKIGIVIASAFLLTASAWAQCDEDIFPNFVVDEFDLGVVAGQYGPCGVWCPGDVNGNGFVGANDEQRILGNLGDCPVEGDANGDGSVSIADVIKIGLDEVADPECRGNVDGSREVNSFDLFIVRSTRVGSDDGEPAAADVDGDGDVDLADEQIVNNGFLDDCSSDIDGDGDVDGDDLDIVACDILDFC